MSTRQKLILPWVIHQMFFQPRSYCFLSPAVPCSVSLFIFFFFLFSFYLHCLYLFLVFFLFLPILYIWCTSLSSLFPIITTCTKPFSLLTKFDPLMDKDRPELLIDGLAWCVETRWKWMATIWYANTRVTFRQRDEGKILPIQRGQGSAPGHIVSVEREVTWS